MCLSERAIAYSATTVLPADVWAATNTDSKGKEIIKKTYKKGKKRKRKEERGKEMRKLKRKKKRN